MKHELNFGTIYCNKTRICPRFLASNRAPMHIFKDMIGLLFRLTVSKIDNFDTFNCFIFLYSTSGSNEGREGKYDIQGIHDIKKILKTLNLKFL